MMENFYGKKIHRPSNMEDCMAEIVDEDALGVHIPLCEWVTEEYHYCLSTLDGVPRVARYRRREGVHDDVALNDLFDAFGEKVELSP